MSNKPPRYETTAEYKAHEKRRKVLRRIGNTAMGTLMSVTALLGVDEALGAHTPTETRLEEIYPSYYYQQANLDRDESKNTLLTYELPGFNADAEYVDTQLANVIDKYGTRIKAVYGDDLSIDNLSERIAAQIEVLPEDDKRTILFYGHSIGGIKSIRVISSLIEDYGMDPSRFAVILDCSPASNADVNTDIRQGFVSFMDFVSYTPLDGGPIARFTAESISAMTDGLDPVSAVERGWKNKSPKPQESSNAVVIAQAHILKSQEELIHAANVLKKNNVPVAFIGPSKTNENLSYRNDGIVHNKSANAEWRKLFGDNLTDYGITEWDLHGIQKRNWSEYADPIDSFLTANGIDPSQPDPLDLGDFRNLKFQADNWPIPYQPKTPPGPTPIKISPPGSDQAPPVEP